MQTKHTEKNNEPKKIKKINYNSGKRRASNSEHV